MRRIPKKSSIQKRERNSLEAPHKKAEIQRETFRRGKYLAFSEDTYLEKEAVPSKVTQKKLKVGLKRRREPSKKQLG